jgi:hypothetical protein
MRPPRPGKRSPASPVALRRVEIVERILPSGLPRNWRIRFKPRAKPPTANEVEERYDHERHPNRIVEEASK